jgi:hypothetical protein
MEFAVIGAVIVVVAGIVIGLAYAGHKAEKQRTEKFAQVAAEMGFDFEPVSPTWNQFGSLPLFSRGHSKKARNVLRKVVRGSELTLIDYQYTVGSGKHRRTYRVTVAVFCADGNQFPANFELRPEGFWHKVGSYFGYQDIDFESHPNFSNAYLLRGTHEAAIRNCFTPQVLEHFEQDPAKWCVETRGNRIAIYQQQRRVKPEELKQFLTDSTRVYLLFAPPAPAVLSADSEIMAGDQQSS